MKYFAIVIILSLSACSLQPDRLLLTQKSFDKLEMWSGGNQLSALEAFRNSCARVLTLKDSQFLAKGIAERWKSVGYWKPVCRRLKKTKINNNKSAQRFFEQNFTPFLASNNHQVKGLFTGYYLPELNGSFTKTSKYKYPIYRLPKNSDLSTQARQAIESGALAGNDLELLYVDDKIELFFLHIQGSGRVRLADGRIIHVGYAGKNNQPYYSIGRHLIANNIVKPEDMSAKIIKEYLRQNPHETDFILNKNPSYVFFRINKNIKSSGAVGSQGVELVAENSIAIDNRYIPYSAPVWLSTTVPSNKKFNQLLIAQDSGGVIKGPVRGDIFFGSGKEAQFMAGHMNDVGAYFILIPRAE